MLMPITEDLKNAGLLNADTNGTAPVFTEPRVWHLLLTEVGRDKSAWWWLQRAGHAVYWPNYTKQVRQAHGRRAERQLSLLPGYLPISLRDGQQDWESLRSSPYVRDVFKVDGHPAVLSERDINAIRAIEAKQAMPIPETERWLPSLGQTVRFLVDLWNDKTGIVIKLAGDQRIGVEMDMLGGGRIMVKVTSSQIAPI